MKHINIEYIVYGMDNLVHIVTAEKTHAIMVAQQIGGRVCKRITTVEEYEALNKACTVWA